MVLFQWIIVVVLFRWIVVVVLFQWIVVVLLLKCIVVVVLFKWIAVVGFSDPFVVMDLWPRHVFPTEHQRQTAIVKKTLNPTFNETFELQV